MPDTENPRRFKILIGGKASSLVPISYHPHLNWTRKKLVEFADNEKTRAIERAQINSGKKIELTKPPQNDPDPAA